MWRWSSRYDPGTLKGFPVCVIAVFSAFSDPAFRDRFPGLLLNLGLFVILLPYKNVGMPPKSAVPGLKAVYKGERFEKNKIFDHYVKHRVTVLKVPAGAVRSMFHFPVPLSGGGKPEEERDSRIAV